MPDPIVSLHKVKHVYPQGTLSLEDVSLTIPKGKKVALLGGNGAGKSTLMLMLNGILKPSSGHLCYKAKPYEYSKKQLRVLRKNVGLIFQNPDNQIVAPTVYEEITFGLHNLYKDPHEISAKAQKAMDEFCLNEMENRSPHGLSIGQKKRVCIAAILAMEPELIVCDEPASSLDPHHAQLIFGYLSALNAKEKTILYSTHDVNHAYSWADHVIMLNKGKVIGEGTPQDVLVNKSMVKEAGLERPFLVEAALALNPEMTKNELPVTLEEFKLLLLNTTALR